VIGHGKIRLGKIKYGEKHGQRSTAICHVTKLDKEKVCVGYRRVAVPLFSDIVEGCAGLQRGTLIAISRNL
jgi:hypothetical protein